MGDIESDLSLDDATFLSGFGVCAADRDDVTDVETGDGGSVSLKGDMFAERGRGFSRRPELVVRGVAAADIAF